MGWRDSETPDANLLRGAKSIADKADWCSHILPITQEDLEKLATIPGGLSYGEPEMKLSIYKNRRGRYKGIYLFCKQNLGTCRIEPLFATTWDFKYTEIENVHLSAF